MTHEKLQISEDLLRRLHNLESTFSLLKRIKERKQEVEIIQGLTSVAVIFTYDEVESLIVRKMKKIEQEIKETQKQFDDL